VALADPAVAAALRAIHGDPARDWTVALLGTVGGLFRAAFARRSRRWWASRPWRI
jgi:hypothetical protein